MNVDAQVAVFREELRALLDKHDVQVDVFGDEVMFYVSFGRGVPVVIDTSLTVDDVSGAELVK